MSQEVSALPQSAPPVPAEVDLGRPSEAAWVIDLNALRVLAASPSGNTWRGGAWREATSLDRAMPAVQDLIHLASGEHASRSKSSAQTLRTLLVWTPGGQVRLRCRCMPLAGPGRRVLVTAAEEAASAAGAGHTTAEASSRAALAHELRTPLGAIAALAEVMMEERLGPMGNARYHSYAEDIHESARHALDVLAAMLGDDPVACASPEEDHADVEEAVAKSVAIMRELARQASVRLETDLAEGRPQVRAEVRSLTQILLNLLSNALKFTPAGGAVIVQTRQAADGSLTLSVSDSGTGMGLDETRVVEEEPTPVGPPEARQPSGQGLSIVRALARASGAQLQIASAPGEGTRVSIIFPPERVRRPGRTAA